MKQGDIVTILFPFSDLSERKLRPAIVLSNGEYNKKKNIILAGIYGRAQPSSISLTNKELIHKMLNKESFISLQNIFSAERSLVGKSIDAVSSKTLELVLQELNNCF